MSDFLYAKPTFIGGAATVIDLFGVAQRYNVSPTPEEADRKALMSDWLALGNDFKLATDKVISERQAK